VKESLMSAGVETAFQEMLDISSDIDKALLFALEGVVASNMNAEAQPIAVAQAQELLRLAGLRAADMGSQPMTQMVIETSAGFVFLVREAQTDGLVIIATGKKGSRVGLALYDLKTCVRDAREGMSNAAGDEATEGEES
jgi:predicted regulator of Ras-like GTPase activity (Roadblock/LC7/MglB family)